MDADSPPGGGDGPQRGGLRRLIVSVAAAALLVSAAAVVRFYLRPRPTERVQALAELFRLLESRGFRANAGLAGSFGPGTLVQVRERDGQGVERELPEPVVLKWGRDCFPSLEPHDLGYELPQSSGHASDQLEVDGTIVDKEAPSLSLKDQSVANYTLRLGRPRLRAYAKGDLSGGFAPACVEALDRAVSSGDSASWYRLVLETLTVQSLDYEVEWRQATDTSSRAALADLLKNQLAGALGPGGGPGVAVQARSAGDNRTVLSASAEAILAYRLRPIELAEIPAADRVAKP